MNDQPETSSRKRIAILGPGSIGCCVGAALQERGHEVVFIARTRFERLRLDSTDRHLDLPAVCISNPEELGNIALLVLTTKAHQTESAVAFLAAALHQGRPILVAQNGVDQVERTLALIGKVATGTGLKAAALPVIPAVVYCSAHRLAPGHTVREGQAKLILPLSDTSQKIAEWFTGSFVDIQLSKDWTSAAWGKLLMNASIGAVCVLARRDMDVLHDAQAATLVLALMEEIIAVGRATGATFPEHAALDVLQAALKASAGHMPSIAQDRLAGLPTEWVARNEVVVRLAARYGVEVPLNAAMTTLLRLGEPR